MSALKKRTIRPLTTCLCVTLQKRTSDLLIYEQERGPSSSWDRPILALREYLTSG